MNTGTVSIGRHATFQKMILMRSGAVQESGANYFGKEQKIKAVEGSMWAAFSAGFAGADTASGMVMVPRETLQAARELLNDELNVCLDSFTINQDGVTFDSHESWEEAARFKTVISGLDVALSAVPQASSAQ